jgi:hypothetical protein
MGNTQGEITMETLFLHTTRGTLSPTTLDEARSMHNAFVGAGSQPGIDIARSLGDISHNTYIPVEETGKLSTASPGELLFIDWWADSNGMEQFFANPFAQEAGNRLFSERVEAEWMPVPAAFTFQVPAKADAPARFVRIMRAPVRVVSDATTALAKLVSANLGASRRFGHLSHQLFLRQANVVTARPASNARHNGGQDSPLPTEPVELLAVDFWPTLEGLREYESASTATNGLDEVLTGPLTVSIWEQVRGFVEW